MKREIRLYFIFIAIFLIINLIGVFYTTNAHAQVNSYVVGPEMCINPNVEYSTTLDLTPPSHVDKEAWIKAVIAKFGPTVFTREEIVAIFEGKRVELTVEEVKRRLGKYFRLCKNV
jgi:hypothetical protein